MCFVIVLPFCPQVEVEYARNALDNLLRNRTLEDLYEKNGKALGMEFTTGEECFR